MTVGPAWSEKKAKSAPSENHKNEGPISFLIGPFFNLSLHCITSLPNVLWCTGRAEQLNLYTIFIITMSRELIGPCQFRYGTLCSELGKNFRRRAELRAEILLPRRMGFPRSVHGKLQHMEVTIHIPDELSAALAAPGQDLSRAAFEALALSAYRERKLSTAQLRQLLGLQTRMELDAFLKLHGVELEYSMEDLERDRQTHRQLGL
jgi:predicted HTH domain antitoxin